MVKGKIWVVAAAMVLVAFGAMASNFRTADQVYVPIAGHIQGGSALFVSDIFISNMVNEPVQVSIIYGPQNGKGAFTHTSYNDFEIVAANLLDKGTRRLLIEDSLEMAEAHEVELFFHCAEQCRVDAVAEGFLIERDGIVLRLVLPAGGAAELYRGSGLGLGLYISSEIAHRHGGELWVESRLGRGSSFHLDLPLAK